MEGEHNIYEDYEARNGGGIEFSDNSKSGELRVLVEVDDGCGEMIRFRLYAGEVIELRDWLNRLIGVKEARKR